MREEKEKIILQPRLSFRNYISQYIAKVVHENGNEDPYAFGGGASLSPKVAKLKAVAECIERYCGSRISEKIIIKSLQELIDEGKNALNPNKLLAFKKYQYLRKEFPYSKYHKNTKIRWIEGYNLTKKENIWVPAFSVYLYYNQFNLGEPRFMPATSNGLAAGKNIKDATLSGLLELIERDAAMITWHCKIIPSRIDLNTIKMDQIKLLISNIAEEKLKLELFVISTKDIPLPVIMALLYSRIKIIPYASFGLACSFSLEEAILKAILEAFMVRDSLMIINQKQPLKKLTPKEIKTFLDHAIFYSFPDNAKYFSFLFNGKIKNFEYFNNYFKKFKFLWSYRGLIKFFRNKNYDIIRVDLTKDIVRKMGFKVVKIISPQLQPLDVNYNACFWGHFRLRRFLRSKGYNKAPHPFA